MLQSRVAVDSLRHVLTFTFSLCMSEKAAQGQKQREKTHKLLFLQSRSGDDVHPLFSQIQDHSALHFYVHCAFFFFLLAAYFSIGVCFIQSLKVNIITYHLTNHTFVIIFVDQLLLDTINSESLCKSLERHIIYCLFPIFLSREANQFT